MIGQGPNDAGDDDFGFLPEFTLPYGYHGPSHRFQFTCLPAIPLHIPLEFLPPELDIRFRQWQIAGGTPMPEASVDEYRHLPTRIADVRMSWDFPLETVPPFTSFTQGLPEGQFRFRILSGIRTHGFRNVGVRRCWTVWHDMRMKVEV